jgi:hypothetical protein
LRRSFRDSRTFLRRFPWTRRASNILEKIEKSWKSWKNLKKLRSSSLFNVWCGAKDCLELLNGSFGASTKWWIKSELNLTSKLEPYFINLSEIFVIYKNRFKK